MMIWLVKFLSHPYNTLLSFLYRFSNVPIFDSCHWSSTVFMIYLLILATCRSWNILPLQITVYMCNQSRIHWHSVLVYALYYWTITYWMHCQASFFRCLILRPSIAMATIITSNPHLCGIIQMCTAGLCRWQAMCSFHWRSRWSCHFGPLKLWLDRKRTFSRMRTLLLFWKTISVMCMNSSIFARTVQLPVSVTSLVRWVFLIFLWQNIKQYKAISYKFQKGNHKA